MPATKYISTTELAKMVRPWGVNRTALYKEWLAPELRESWGVKYGPRGQMRFPLSTARYLERHLKQVHKANMARARALP